MIIRKALTFRASSIGDCLMGKYLLENIHAAYPSARLGIVVASRAAMIRSLFSAYPWLEIIEANRRSPKALIALWSTFRGSDLVVTQYSGKGGGTFGLASKIAARILARPGGLVGFTDVSKWNRVLYDRLIPVRADVAVAEHEREVVKACGCSVSIPFPTLAYISDEAVLAPFHLEAGKYVVAHFFAGGAGRSLSPEKSRELLAALGESLPQDMTIVVSGSSADRPVALAIADGTRARVIAGDTNLHEMMNLIARSQGVVSVDTGMAHITAQLGKPLAVIRTCLGRNWWFTEQYGKSAPITVFSCDDACTNGHVYQDYPDCISAIDVRAVAHEAVNWRRAAV